MPFIKRARATTTVVKTIGSGGDYSTIQLWIASLNGLDLVTADQIQQGKLLNEEFTAAGIVADFNVASVTTNSTHYVELTVSSALTFSNGLFYNTANGAGIRNTGAAGGAVAAGGYDLRLVGLQIKGDAGSGGVFLSQNVSSVLIIDKCIFQGTEALFQNTGAVTINNSAFINTLPQFSRGLVLIGAGPFNFNFCDCVVPAGVAIDNMVDYGTATVTANFKSCALFGAATALSTRDASATITYTTCATDLVSPPSGVTGSLTYANQFVSTTNDFREKAGANLQGAGTADATNGAFDIAGLARPQGSNWDIGAWELQAASSSAAGRMMLMGVGN